MLFFLVACHAPALTEKGSADPDCADVADAPDVCTDGVDGDCDGDLDDGCDAVEIGCAGSEDVDLSEGLCWAQANGATSARVCAGTYTNRQYIDFDYDCADDHGPVLYEGFTLLPDPGVVIEGSVAVRFDTGAETTFSGLTLRDGALVTEGPPNLRFEGMTLDGVLFVVEEGEAAITIEDSEMEGTDVVVKGPANISIHDSVIAGADVAVDMTSGVLDVIGSRISGGIRAIDEDDLGLDVRVLDTTIEASEFALYLSSYGTIDLYMDGDTITNNGSGVMMDWHCASARVTVQHSAFTDNAGAVEAFGSAISSDCPTTFQMTDSTVTDNVGWYSAIFFWNEVSASIMDSQILRNSGQYGGMYLTQGTLESESTEWADNDPADVSIMSRGYSFDGVASFSCDAETTYTCE